MRPLRRPTQDLRVPRAFLLAAACALVARALPAQHPLVTLPVDDPAYRQLDALERVGCAPARIGPYRPYLVSDVRRAARDAASDPRCPALMVDALEQRFARDSVAGIPDSSGVLLGLPPDSLTTPRDTGEGRFAAPGLSFGAQVTGRFTMRGDADYRPLWRDVRADGDPAAVLVARGRVQWSAGERFVAVSEAYLQSNRQNDPTVRAKTVRGSGGFLDVGESYLAGRVGPLTLSFGRSNEAWLARGRESLVLSANGPLMDRVQAAGRWRAIEARALIALLDDVVVDEARDSLAAGTGSARFQRALAAHALTWKPVPGIELTLGETVLFSRRGAPVDFAYFNPVVPYIVAQNDTGRTGAEGRDNIVVFGGTRVQYGRFVAEGEVVVDDVQVDAEDRAVTADQLAWRAATSVALAVESPTIATLEYRRIGSFTYSRGLYSEVYQSYGAPLGSELGPDADLLSVEVERWPNGVVRVAGAVGFWRHGATRLERRPAESPNFHAGHPYPSVRRERPEVQRAFLWSLEAGLASGRFPITARLESANLQGVNNVRAATASYMRMQVVGSYALNYP